jgi:hypothetical protein
MTPVDAPPLKHRAVVGVDGSEPSTEALHWEAFGSGRPKNLSVAVRQGGAKHELSATGADADMLVIVAHGHSS